jgi:small subunit ribosomal protein S16
MLKIRLQRTGRINQPSYRIIVTEHARSPKTGNFVEELGTYNPHSKAHTLNDERVKYWMSVGAQPSATMHNMLVRLGIVKGKKINVLPKFKAPETPAAEAQAEAPAAETKTEEAPAQA